MRKQSVLSAAIAVSLVLGTSVVYAYDENFKDYDVYNVNVTADGAKDQYGNTITEQSYYRTGGDVKVITREEIEKRHYRDVTEAIKRVPGVTFQNPGYRGGEYGYQFYNNGVSINGDSRVVILVDGRRVDNAASGRVGNSSKRGTKSTGVNLDEVTTIDAIDKIEVIKGPGASQYGSDATGGVINIITRRGKGGFNSSIDVSTGSWHKHNYNLTMQGSAGKDGNTGYFITATRSMSQDTKYKDGDTGEVVTLGGSKWREQGINARIDHRFNKKQELQFSVNFKAGHDGYPISTPSMKYWNQNDWRRIIANATVGQFDENYKLIQDASYVTPKNPNGYAPTLYGNTKNPGYHNLYALDGRYGSYSQFRNTDLDLKYTFDRQGQLESFVRLYHLNHHYEGRDKYAWYRYGSNANARAAYATAFPNGTTAEAFNAWVDANLAPFPGGDQNALRQWIADTGGMAGAPTSWYNEIKNGIELQWGRSLDKHDIIANIDYSKSKLHTKSIGNTGTINESDVKRDTLYAYIQDKIYIGNNVEITPAIRYARYGSFESTGSGQSQGRGDTHAITPSLHGQFKFNKKTSAYAGWTKIMRPLKRGDYTSVDGIFNTPLDDEKGDAYTFGVRHVFGKNNNTAVAVHYDYTRMKNAVATLPIFDTASGDFKNTAVNAKEDKKSFNITVDHQLNKHITMSASYSHMKDKWMSKGGWVLDPDWGYRNSDDINVAINSLRPQNHYSLNISYDNNRLYSGLLLNWYTGNSTYAFTHRQFLIVDWNLNYEVTKDVTAYVVVNNLLNKAYETSYSTYNGRGSAAMPARSFMVGVKYKF
ncbi:TonB-dependent receptor plug domain-containing protein [Veillonella caviae]|uniref:TonB-dependent receptor plug domain-containing protein n=1 Tax=Veillonella caviae TaxID=248316 RepID=UPI0023A7FCAE|nr:TonB-dependent receptor [Veillonella caviae]MCI5709344.1 TonB-dependent receptor [Veillonella caviae]MDY5715356.1 TonB-dependent receptor [Veillonella caviae]